MIEFRIKNKKQGLFKYAPVMTNLEVIELIASVSQYSYNEDAQNFNRNAFYNDTLDNSLPYILGRELENVWGFKIGYDKKSNDYVITLVDLATTMDWKLAIIYLRALSQKLGNPIISGGRKYTEDSIVKYDFDTILKYYLNILITDIEYHQKIFYPIKRPMVFGPTIFKFFAHSQDKVKEYEKIAHFTQYPDVYVHEQTFHFYKENTKLIFGNYSIADNFKCILPSKPFIERKNEGKFIGRQFAHWSLYILFRDEDENLNKHALVKYDSFINNLDQNKYTWIDDNFILIEELTKEELAEIAEKCEKIED